MNNAIELFQNNHKDIDLNNWVSFLLSKDIKHPARLDDMLKGSKSKMLGVMKYRRALISEGIGGVSFLEVNTAYTDKNFDELHSLLQDLFLEYIPKDKFKFILNKLDNVEYSLIKLYQGHEDNENMRIMSIILSFEKRVYP